MVSKGKGNQIKVKLKWISQWRRQKWNAIKNNLNEVKMKGKNKQLSYEFGKRNSQIKYSFFNIINLKTNYQKNIQKKN